MFQGFGEKGGELCYLVFCNSVIGSIGLLGEEGEPVLVGRVLLLLRVGLLYLLQRPHHFIPLITYKCHCFMFFHLFLRNRRIMDVLRRSLYNQRRLCKNSITLHFQPVKLLQMRQRPQQEVYLILLVQINVQ